MRDNLVDKSTTWRASLPTVSCPWAINYWLTSPTWDRDPWHAYKYPCAVVSRKYNNTMKSTALILSAVFGSTAAFAPVQTTTRKVSTSYESLSFFLCTFYITCILLTHSYLSGLHIHLSHLLGFYLNANDASSSISLSSISISMRKNECPSRVFIKNESPPRAFIFSR